MSTRRKVLVGAGVVLLLGVLIFRALRADRGDVVEVRAEEVGHRDLVAHVTATGHIEPRRSVQIQSDISGRIVRLTVEEGQDVEEGDLLLEIDPTQYRAAVRQARARLSEARSRQAQARADYLQARREWERMEKLQERTPDLVTAQEAEQARTRAEVREAELEAAEHSVDQAEAALEEAQDRLDKTVIRAPMSGQITRLNVEQGETAIVGTMNNPGSLLLTIADLSTMEAVVEVDETDVTRVSAGDSASVEIDAFPDRAFAGRVTKIGNSSMQPRTGAGAGQDDAVDFEVRVLLDDPPAGIRPDLSATADIITARRPDALSIPIISLTLQDTVDLGEGWRGSATADPTLDRGVVEGVFVVEGDEARFRPVRVGIAGNSYFEVTEGLTPGDTVVSGTYQAVRDLRHGDRVELTEVTPRPDPPAADGDGNAGDEEAGDGTGASDTEGSASTEADAPRTDGATTASDAEVDADDEDTAFFVVVVSARDSAGVAGTVEGLGTGGRPIHIRPYRDDRDRLWWRGMLGPYEERATAEDRAEDLREAGLETDPWVGRFPAVDASTGASRG